MTLKSKMAAASRFALVSPAIKHRQTPTSQITISMAKGNSKKTKGQRRDDLERKRDERSRRTALKKEKQIKEYLENDENFVSFRNQLEAIGFKIKDILGDGNCLFRALGDQLNGDQASHHKHRKETVKYMREHREDFEPFMEEDITFDKHLQQLSQLGVYGGNDSIVAFARNNGVDVVIHQLNEPRWVIHGREYSKTGHQIELHISYHNGEHYSSVRRISDPDDGPAWLHHDRQRITTEKEKTKGNKQIKENKKKERWKEKEKEKSMTEQQNGACGGTDPSPEEIVMSATACEDLPLVLQTLEENNYDVDMSIGYILQIMCLSQQQADGCAVGLNSSDRPMDYGSLDTGIPTYNSSADTIDEEQTCMNTDAAQIMETIDTTLDRSMGNDLLETSHFDEQVIMSFDDGNGDVASGLMSGESSKTLNLEEHESTNNISGKSSLSGTSENSGLSLSKINPKSGARPKQISKPKGIKNNSHLSNRQRKEQARVEKKKRREERRKEESSSTLVSTTLVSTDDCKTDVKTVAEDLGVLSI